LQEFTFEIEYKKGELHANADAVSRPVLLVGKVVDEDEEEIVSADPYDNEALIYYLEYGRHRKGASKCSVKRIMKLADHYRMDSGKLSYRKDVDALEYKEVPIKEERKELITKFHVKGHSNSVSRVEIKILLAKDV
jgi:hypothetical protein